eukprot:Em0001g1070a
MVQTYRRYLHKYSVLQRKCCNVFDQHKDCKPRKKSLREITRDKLCSLCRTHLQKLSVQAPEEFPTLVDLPIPGPPTSYLNEELPLSAFTESTSDDSVVHGVDIEEVIHYLNLTPVKLVHEISSGERTAVVSIVGSLQIDTSDVTKGSYIALLELVVMFFLKRTTLVGFVKVTFFARLSTPSNQWKRRVLPFTGINVQGYKGS